MKNTIQSQWKLFETIAMSSDAPEIQKIEMRRAFYAGIHAMLMMQYQLGDKSMSDEAGAAIMQGWYDEVKLFAQNISKGIC